MHPVVHKFGHHAKRHYHERYVKPHGLRAHIILTIDGILVAIILGLLGLGSYFAFIYDPLRDTFKMRFEETELASGGTAEIVLTVENIGKTRLTDAAVDVHFPPQFRVYSQSKETDHEEVTADGIPRGAALTYRFQGLLLGPAGTAPIFARMRATDGFGTTDERLIEGRLTWHENRIALSWDAPTTVLSGQDIPLKLRVRNSGDATLTAARLALILPDDFTIRLSSPPFGADGIPLDELRPGDELEMELLGSFPVERDIAVAAFRAELRIQEPGGETLVAETSTEMAVISADVSVEASFADDAAYARPGDAIGFRILYRNDSLYTLRDLKLRLPLDIRHADLSASDAHDGGRAGSSLGWETATLESLDAVPPGASGEVTGTIRILREISKYSVNPILALEPEATFDLADFGVDDARLFGEGATLKIAGRVETGAVARYYTNEGDQIGRGTLPPRVGATTRYWVVLKAENGATNAENARLSVRLPDHVQWTGKAAVTAGSEILEAEGGRVLIWNIGTITPHAGIVSSAPNVSIELALTPTSALVGTSPMLISGATLTATDTWTGLSMSSDQGSLTTELPTDPFIEGRTVVRP